MEATPVVGLAAEGTAMKAAKGVMVGLIFAAAFWLLMWWLLRERPSHIPEFFRG